MTKQYIFSEGEYEALLHELKNAYTFINRTINESTYYNSDADCAKEYIENALNIVDEMWNVK